jgi:prolyl-tRNA editing enzyme YbaK/EbsC (Cys-tRNA(Pro) deacylase)
MTMCNIKATPFLVFLRQADSRKLFFKHYPDAYAHDVLDCVNAARARNVPLIHELKHLLLETGAGYHMVHLTGNVRLSLREVKRHLGRKEARLADLAKFPDARLRRGTVCPFLEPLWPLPHLVDQAVLQMPWMTTNDGTTRGYVKFDPEILSMAPNCAVGNFSDKSLGSIVDTTWPPSDGEVDSPAWKP